LSSCLHFIQSGLEQNRKKFRAMKRRQCWCLYRAIRTSRLGLNDMHSADNIHGRIPMKLTDRTILITGGSTGIGLAFALKFVELGNQVIVTGRRQAVLGEVQAKYPKLHTIQSDVADPGQITALAARVKADFPKLDVLMNNAGMMLYKNLRAPAADLAGLMAELNVNVGGVISTTSAFIATVRS